MRVPTPVDFRALETWGLVADPMTAVAVFERVGGDVHRVVVDVAFEVPSHEFTAL
jgi:hypothetical protein